MQLQPKKIGVQMSTDSYMYIGKGIGCFFEATRAIKYYKVIFSASEDNEHKISYLIWLHGVNFDMAVLSWCKIFGSEASNDLHYLHLVEKTDLLDCLKKIGINNKQDLKNNLLKTINKTEMEFDEYLDKSIKKYRDEFIAHFDLDVHIKYFDDPSSEEVKKLKLDFLPIFDIAEKSLIWFYDLLAQIVRCKESDGHEKAIGIFNIADIESNLKSEIDLLIEKLK